MYTYPGVYTKVVSSGVRTISSAPTSVALFVGPAKAGIDGRPTRLFNFGDFERNFGGLSQTSSLSYAVMHFFANGGGEAFVIRVPAKDSKAASSKILSQTGTTDEAISLTALSSGAAGNDIYVEFDPFGLSANPFATTGYDKKHFNLTVTDRLTGRVERFTGLSMIADEGSYAPTVVNDPATGSRLVNLTAVAGKDCPKPNGTVYTAAIPATAPTGAIVVNVSVDMLNATGAADSTGSLSNFKVTVAGATEARPTTVAELAARLTAAVNAAITASAASAGPGQKMEGVAIEATSFEGGTQLRLRAAPLGAVQTTKRVTDAIVKLSDPTTLAAGEAGFVAGYLTAAALNESASRYRLGETYGSAGQVIVATTPATPVKGSDGSAGGQPDDDVFKKAVMDLAVPDPFFNILGLPDVVRPKADDPKALQHANAWAIYAEAARICAAKHAFLLVDPFPGVADTVSAEAWKSLKFTFQSNCAAAYFPNIRADDPLMPGAIRAFAPSGAVAGVFARTDAQFGVWQAPAGTDAFIAGTYGPSVALSNDEQGVLNPIGLNCIRKLPIFGTVVFGSRTVDGSNAAASEWKYVPVKRTASFILRSLQEGLTWAVHQKNGEQLWSQLRMNVTAFMHGLFKQGAFQGVSSRDAYFVRCDASTTSADDMNNGIVNIVIGFAPLKPAEFVVITLSQIVRPLV